VTNASLPSASRVTTACTARWSAATTANPCRELQRFAEARTAVGDVPPNTRVQRARNEFVPRLGHRRAADGQR
jgi:hypothetical protein